MILIQKHQFKKSIIFIFCCFFLSAFSSVHARGLYKDVLADTMNSLLFLKKLRQTPSVQHHQCAVKRFLMAELTKQAKFAFVANNQMFAFFPDMIGDENVRKNVIEDVMSSGFSVHEDERIIWVEHNQEQLVAFFDMLSGFAEDQSETDESFLQIIYLGNGKTRRHVIYID